MANLLHARVLDISLHESLSFWAQLAEYRKQFHYTILEIQMKQLVDDAPQVRSAADYVDMVTLKRQCDYNWTVIPSVPAGIYFVKIEYVGDLPARARLQLLSGKFSKTYWLCGRLRSLTLPEPFHQPFPGPLFIQNGVPQLELLLEPRLGSSPSHTLLLCQPRQAEHREAVKYYYCHCHNGSVGHCASPRHFTRFSTEAHYVVSLCTWFRCQPGTWRFGFKYLRDLSATEIHSANISVLHIAPDRGQLLEDCPIIDDPEIEPSHFRVLQFQQHWNEIDPTSFAVVQQQLNYDSNRWFQAVVVPSLSGPGRLEAIISIEVARSGGTSWGLHSKLIC
eukprot:Protomagalhaensia_wolfi_Nauph_80__3264@NODE_331_length_2772_cov_34_596780_g249_i0_p2_GENE_NODE_331_length_2772_cov_34_596780_g249_i0NODE_331_length_2772_cov_34_596780_g249_i0_p2_ORF_typecomplete_len393_score32_03_NODE_331_length_2772_cov_34_596780_g249_i015932597